MEYKSGYVYELMDQADSQGVLDNDYREFVCDGWAWKWQVRYSDNRIKVLVGDFNYRNVIYAHFVLSYQVQE